MKVVMGSDAHTPQGLQLLIKPGEMLPWKNIWFVVEHVGPESVILKPRSTTAAFHKKKERAHGAADRG